MLWCVYLWRNVRELSLIACVLYIVIVLDHILPTLVNTQGKDEGGRNKIYRRCSQLQSINNRTSFFLIIVTIVIYSVVQYYNGDLVFCVRAYVCVYIYTHEQMQRQTSEEEKKKRAACVHTHKHIGNARGKKKKKKIVELILRRRTPYKNSVLYVECSSEWEKECWKKRNWEIDWYN